MIRDAVRDDVQTIVEIARTMHAESKFAAYDFDPDKLADLVLELIETPRGLVFVAEVDSQVVGGFVGGVSTHFFGNDLVSSDYGTFVVPEHRNTGVGAELILAYVERAKALGVDEISIANSTGYKPEKVAALFKALGFSQDGYVFSMRAKQ